MLLLLILVSFGCGANKICNDHNRMCYGPQDLSANAENNCLHFNNEFKLYKVILLFSTRNIT